MKIAVITGVTSGIGKETLRGVLAAQYQVIMVGRNELKSKATQQEMMVQFPNATLQYVLADLSDMEQVKTAAEQITAMVDKVDLLINNAGVMFSDRQLTVDGFEQTLAVNHFAYFLLTEKLLPLLRAAGRQDDQARIVNVASRAHRRTSLNVDDIMFDRRRYRGFVCYCQSKLANVLYTRELSNRLTEDFVTANSLHPGVVNTHFLRNTSGILGRLMKLFFSFQLSPEQGAATTLFLALDKSVEGKSGGYYSDCKRVEPSSQGGDDALAASLWEYTESTLQQWL